MSEGYTGSAQPATETAARRAATVEELGRWKYTAAEEEAQRAAREAVLEIPHFPELEKRLIGVFGFSPAVVFMHQMIWWFGRPGMKDRWTMYKTSDEWHGERGINRKALGKARQRAKNAGMIEEKLGPYKRVHYRIDWVRLASLLGLSLPLRVQKDEKPDAGLSLPLRVRKAIATFKGTQSIDPLTSGYKLEEDPRTYAANGHENTAEISLNRVQTNTGELAGEHLQESSAPQPKNNLKSSSTAGAATLDSGTIPTSDPPQQEAAREGGGEPPPRSAPPLVADPDRVAIASATMRQLFGDWGGYRSYTDEGRWGELSATLVHLGYAEERHSAAELMLAARELEQPLEKAAV